MTGFPEPAGPADGPEPGSQDGARDPEETAPPGTTGPPATGGAPLADTPSRDAGAAAAAGPHGPGPGVPGNAEHLARLERLSRLGGEEPADGVDPVERLLRPATTYLAPPPGAFDAIRGRAARRRRLRTLAGVGTAAAVAVAAMYAGGVLAPHGDGQAVAPPATSGQSSLPVPPPAGTHGGPPAPGPTRTTTAPAVSGGPATGATKTPASPPPSTPPSSSPSPSEGTPMCTAGQLSVALGGGDAGAGQLYRYLVLTNASGSACHVDGYPGVSLLDADGHQIGKPADREPRSYAPVVLRPGDTASDTIHTANGMGTCEAASAKVRVYPPGSRQALTADAVLTICDGTFTITPLAPGSTGNPPG